MQSTAGCNTAQKRERKTTRKKGHRTLLEQKYIHRGDKRRNKRSGDGALFWFFVWFVLSCVPPQMNLSKQTRQPQKRTNLSDSLMFTARENYLFLTYTKPHSSQSKGCESFYCPLFWVCQDCKRFFSPYQQVWVLHSPARPINDNTEIALALETVLIHI